ncbi:MAG: autotransporter-associated beta strand repeat-containing protein, partial [Chthoniobacteraceae bacterium]
MSAQTGGELRLDGAAAPAKNRLPDDATLTLGGGHFSLTGHGTSAVEERIGTLVIGDTGGNVVTITSPGTARTTLAIENYSNASGDALFRGDALGDLTRVIFDAPPSSVGGIVPGVFVGSASIASATSFAVYDSSVAGGAIVGLRPQTAAEVTPAIVIQNPANGGTIPETAHVEIGGPGTAVGPFNTVASLTLTANGTLTLENDQTLRISTGGILIRADATSPSFNGGTLDFGPNPGVIYLGTDTTISSALSGLAEVRKTGPGRLHLAGTVAAPGGFDIAEGVLQSAGSPFADGALNIASNGVFDLADAPATVGVLSGSGSILLGSGTLTIGTLPGFSSFSGIISGTGDVVIVDGGTPRAARSFSGASTYSGGTVLQSGRLNSSNFAALGTGPLTINGGTLSAFFPGNFGVPIQLGVDLFLDGNLTNTFSPAATTTGAHSVEVRGRGDVVVQAPWSHTGETRTGFATAEPPSAAAGSLTLAGASGALLSTSAISVGPGSALVLDDEAFFAGGSGGRVGDSTPIVLRSAGLELRGNVGTTTLERIGPLEMRGHSTITVAPGVGAAAAFEIASLQRGDRSTVLFRAPGLGDLPANGVGSIMFDVPLTGLVGGGGTGPATSILPYAVGDTSATGSGSGLVTYDPARGVRMLDAATEYLPTLESAGATDNVRLTANTANDNVRPINALVLIGAASISGAGTLEPGSGVIMKSGDTASDAAISNDLNFGTVEGRIYVAGSTGGLRIDGAIHGSNGLTKAGPQPLTLTTANPFAGPLTINAGDVIFGALEHLGADSGAIVFNGGAPASGLSYNAAAPLDFTRDIEVRDGIGFLRTQIAGADVTLSGSVSGAGGLGISGPATGIAYVNLTGTNTYTGPTIVHGAITFSSDAALGDGGVLELGGTAPRVRLDGDWTTARNIVLSGPATLDTTSFDATWNGTVLTVGGGLTKRGEGTLVLTAASAFSGTITSAEGTVLVNANGALGSFTAASGGIFRFDNGMTSSSDRVGDSRTVTLGGGRIEFLGHPSVPIRERFATLALGSSGHGTLAITAPGTASTILEAGNFTSTPFTTALWTIRGDNLAGGPNGAFTRLTFQTPPVLSGGLLPRTLVDSGGAETFATYDSSDDASGLIGVRALRAEEYVGGSIVQNPANGGTTSVEANFLLSEATVASGAENTLNSLTLQDGGSLSLRSSQSLTIGSQMILAPRGPADATIRGGTLIFPSGIGLLVGDGDMTFGSRVTGRLVKFGLGTLTFTGDFPINTSSFTIGEGRLRPGPGAPIGNIPVTIDPGGVLEVANGVTTRVGGVTGTGTVMLTSGTLQIGGAFSSTSFSGRIVGPGTLEYTQGIAPFFSKADEHTGPSVLSAGARLTLSGSGTMLETSGIRLSNLSRLTLNNSTTALGRIEAVPITINGRSTLTLIGSRSVSFTENAGPLIPEGSGTVRVEASAGDGADGITTRLAFQEVSRPARGTISVQLVPATLPAMRPVSLHLGSVADDLIGAGTTATNVPILPYAVSTTPAPAFVTHDEMTGVRALDPATELTPDLTPGANVRLDNGATLTGDVAVNALQFGGTIDGTGTLHITSGAILASSGSVNVPIDFGSREGLIYSLTATGRLLTIFEPITGSNGLTFTGAGIGQSAALGLRG